MENSFDLYKDEEYIVPGAEASPDLNYKPSSQTIKEQRGEQTETPSPKSESPSPSPSKPAENAEPKKEESKEEDKENLLQTIYKQARLQADPVGWLLNYDGPNAEKIAEQIKNLPQTLKEGGEVVADVAKSTGEYLMDEAKEKLSPDNIARTALDFATDQFAPTKSLKDAINVADLINQNQTGEDRENRASQEAEASLTLGAIDFAFDVVGNNKVLSPIDDFWDEKTKFKTPLARDVRDLASVIIPSMVGGGAVSSQVARMSGANALTRRVAGLTGRAVVDAGVARVSDYSERDEGVMNALDGLLDRMGNPLGMNIPEAAKVQDSDSMETRKTKLQWEAAGASVFADALGFLFGRGKKLLGWYKPKDEAAKQFADSVKAENPDAETLEAISQARKLAEEATDLKTKKQYTEAADRLEQVMKEDGVTEATTDGMESFARKAQTTRDLQNDEVASVHVMKHMEEKLGSLNAASAETQKTIDAVSERINKLKEAGVESDELPALEKALGEQQTIMNDLQQKMVEAQQEAIDTIPFKPEVHKDLVEEADTFKEATPPASTVRNSADFASMADGNSPRSVPAPVVSDAEIENGFKLDEPSASIIRSKAEEVRQAGNFDSLLNDAAYTQKDRDDAAWQLLADTIRAKDIDEVRNLYMTRRDTKNLRNKVYKYLNAEQSRAASQSLKFMIDYFLDPDVVLTSARATETLGREASAIAEAMTTFKGAVNDDKIMEVVMNKMAFLFEERGMAKYVAGWSLQNVAWWKKIGKSEKGLAKMEAGLLEEMAAGFSEAQKFQREKAKKMVETFDNLRKNDPEKARLFAAAVDHSEGNIDTLDKLNKFIENQISLGGVFIDKDGKGGNLFGSTLKSIWFNNVLSGASAGKAAVGGATQQLLLPLEYLVGSLADDLMNGGKYKMTKSGLYAYSSIQAANKQALTDSWQKFMKFSKDPESVEAAIRADYRMRNDQAFELLEQSIPTLEKEGKHGQKFMANWTLFNRDMARNPIIRWGTNAMVGIDQYSATLNSTAASRFRSYWDAMETGTIDQANLMKGESKHYANIFDKDGLIKDAWVNETTSAIALNADNVVGDGISALTGYIPALTPFVAFPRTSTNWIRRSMEYTPIFNLIPPKVRKTLLASSSDEIADAMALHGILPDDPHLERIWRNQRAIYMGRVALGTATVMGLMNYALQGNIRGNWPRNSAQKKAWQEANIKPKTIDIAGVQVSYDGMLPFDPLLTIIGDMATYSNDISTPVMHDVRDKLIWTLSNSFVNNTPLGGLEPLVALAGGDDSAATRWFANQARAFIPMSGAMGVVANATNSAQKDIYNDFNAYIMNRIPIINAMLPTMRDPYTGKDFDDITNPFLRIINAVSPMKYYPGPEEWRKKLVGIGMPGLGILRKDSTGTFEYDAETRRAIYGFMGEQEPWREIEKLLDPEQNPSYNEDVEQIRALRNSGQDSEKIKIDEQKIPLIDAIRTIMRQAQERAEMKMLADPKYAHFKETRRGQKLLNKYLSTGQIPEAIRMQQETVRELDELKQLGVGN